MKVHRQFKESSPIIREHMRFGELELEISPRPRSRFNKRIACRNRSGSDSHTAASRKYGFESSDWPVSPDSSMKVGMTIL